MNKQVGVNESLPELFISYSKDDIQFQKNFLKHLSGLRDQIVTWNDLNMLPGEEWDSSIKDKLRSANVVVYLVSHNSIATDYIQNVELPLVMERCDNKECVLIPVIVDFCSWQGFDFAKYNALPNKGQPVTHKDWTNQNEAWVNVVDGIKRIIASSQLGNVVKQPNSIIPESKIVIILPDPKPCDDWQTIDQYRIKDGLAFDTKTDLLWLRFAYGQTWENGTTQCQAVHMDWDTAAAANYFNKQGGYSGYSDWRLPTVDELESLLNKHKGKEGDYIHPDVFPNNNGAVFWSSSSYASDGSNAWGVDFYYGYDSVSNAFNDGQVRLVRIGQ